MPSLHVMSLRQFSAAEAERLRRAVAETLADLAAVAGSSALTMTVGSTGERTTLVFETAQNLGAPASLAAEVEEVLRGIGVIERVDAAAAASGDFYPIIAALESTTEGYADGENAGQQHWKLLADRRVLWDDTVELVDLVSRRTDIAFRVELERDPTSRVDNKKWLVTAGFVSSGAGVPLRMQAWVHRCLPGFTVRQAAVPLHDPTQAMTIPHELMLHFFRIPVTAGAALAGIPVAPPGVVPVYPRPAHNEFETRGTEIRAGVAYLPTGRPVELDLTERERRRHVHVFGRTGTGKSSLLAALAHSVGGTDGGALVIDPHGPLIDRIVAELPASAIDRTWLIRAADIDNPVRINPLAVSDPVRRDIVIQDYQQMFGQLFDPQQTGIAGPRFEERLGAALRLLIALRGERASLLDVPAILHDRALADRAAAASGDPRLRRWYENDKATAQRSSEYGELVSWFNSKFERFVNNPAIVAAIGTGADSFDPARAMDEGRIILVDLSKGKLGEVASRMLGFLYIARFWYSTLQRQTDRTFTVMIDEVQSFSSYALPNMLSEGRKFGLSVVLCHQYLSQLEPQLLSAVTGNVGTTIAFRTGLADVSSVSALLGGLVDPAKLVTLPDLAAYAQRSAGPVAPSPHTLIVDHNKAGFARTGDELRRVAGRLEEQTHHDLVAPHRDVKSLTDDLSGAPRPKSFVDDWITRRQAGSPKPTEDSSDAQ